MKKIFLLVLLMGVALCQAVAQQDAKAESILSKMADSYRKADWRKRPPIGEK